MLKPTIKKLKDLRGRIKGYRATYGVMRVEGETAKAAEFNVETAVLNALMRLDRGTLVGVWRGHTYVVSPDTVGWRYWIDTHSRTDYYIQMPTTDGTGKAQGREEAQDAAMFGLAQGLWTPEVEDDAAFVEGLSTATQRELLSWIAWQRRYAAAVAAGKSGTEAHAIASGLA